MKKLIIALLLMSSGTVLFGQATNLLMDIKEKEKEETVEEITISPQNYYKYRADGKPGRGLVVHFNNKKFIGEGKIVLECNKEVIEFPLICNDSIESYEILLPPNVAKTKAAKLHVSISSKTIAYTKVVDVPAFRHWEIMIYPHSHVDIGYTNTHENVELIHTRNLINGIKLAEATKDYPEGARYVWNPEVIWPVERYLSKATEEEKQVIFEGIRNGYLALDAGYVNVNTSVSGDEELMELFRQAKEYEKITGKKIETIVQVDIPGMSWGIVPVAAKLGVKYCFSLNNGQGRIGWSMEQSFKPFWWADESGNNRILYFQPGSYNPGALIKGKYFWPKMAGQLDPTKLLEIVKTDNPRENFIDIYINEKLPELEKADYYPYDIFAMTWAMADNTPIDADLPEAVKSWNEEFAYPKLTIASATDIMSEFEDRYGDQIPVLKGDFTEFWTDGTGTAAKQTAQNRESKERLVQAETLWTMLRNGEPALRNDFNQAWWNVLMGSEHTWCYMNPSQEPINSDIQKTKFAFFDNAEKMSQDLLAKTLPAEEGKYIAVFNNLSWNHDGLVTLSAETAKGFSGLIDTNGEKVKSQKLSSGELVFEADDVPAFGSKKYKLSKKAYVSKSKMANGNVLDNGIVHVEINQETGDVSSLKMGNKEFVDSNAACAINSYRYLKGDDTPEEAFALTDVEITIKENGPLLATISVRGKAEGCTDVATEITIFDGQETVDFKNVIQKIKTIDKEGVHFGFAFDVDNPVVVADIPWGVMEIEKDQLETANRNWITLQRWLNVSNKEKGITWCPLDAPMFQVGTITANLLGDAYKSEKWIRELKPDGTIYSWALNNHWYTNFPLSQGSELTFRYRVKPHLNSFDYVSSNRFAMEQYQPLVASKVDRNFEVGQLLTVEGSPFVNSTVFKTSEDGKSALLRLRSWSEKDEPVSLKWKDRKPASIHVFDIMTEQSLEEIHADVVVPSKDFITLKVTW
ncbi:hypothetical protein L3049_05200 [Labilibaculum sp. DW002]|uniref:Glycosyl hydrolase n=1 Tax=Paralabilibaculum antarcticum TaxID=2912572 RepID=A0ABT5VPP0_9BACT|nr:glycoside hydrolase family 38 C-terminal domain-containing protein [Labilibaculum sp. DW002]MDE5417398.1 hypothetical protein [Labilibaculum sp. DW002]